MCPESGTSIRCALGMRRASRSAIVRKHGTSSSPTTTVAVAPICWSMAIGSGSVRAWGSSCVQWKPDVPLHTIEHRIQQYQTADALRRDERGLEDNAPAHGQSDKHCAVDPKSIE